MNYIIPPDTLLGSPPLSNTYSTKIRKIIETPTQYINKEICLNCI